MIVKQDTIRDLIDGGLRIACVPHEAQEAAVAKHLASLLLGCAAGELRAVRLESGDYRVMPFEGITPAEEAAKIISGWPEWKQRICMLQPRFRIRRG